MKNAVAKAFTPLVVTALLFGCSSFNSEWKKVALEPVPVNSMTGRWEGTWASLTNGHTGTLRCLMSKTNEAQYIARFRATYKKILSFSYTVPLSVDPHYDGWEFSGEADLGKAAGGNYYYEGRANPTNFFSTYKATKDHGVFEMRRPK